MACGRLSILQFQSTPPARGATQGERIDNDTIAISIHAPREGGDCCHRLFLPCWVISIHAPREGGDQKTEKMGWMGGNFNPRPPRGGRRCPSGYASAARNFNPRPPRGGRPRSFRPWRSRWRTTISIHAPREGGDGGGGKGRGLPRVISIHAPREGGDLRPVLLLHGL